MIHSPETETWYQNWFSNHNYINYVIPSILFRKKRSLPILLHHVQLARSSVSLPRLCLPSLSTDCLSFPPWGGGGRALLHPLPPADPISLRSQATARFYFRHSWYLNFWCFVLKNMDRPILRDGKYMVNVSGSCISIFLKNCINLLSSHTFLRTL
jgi:hypothetical protein